MKKEWEYCQIGRSFTTFFIPAVYNSLWQPPSLLLLSLPSYLFRLKVPQTLEKTSSLDHFSYQVFTGIIPGLEFHFSGLYFQLWHVISLKLWSLNSTIPTLLATSVFRFCFRRFSHHWVSFCFPIRFHGSWILILIKLVKIWPHLLL